VSLFNFNCSYIQEANVLQIYQYNYLDSADWTLIFSAQLNTLPDTGGYLIRAYGYVLYAAGDFVLTNNLNNLCDGVKNNISSFARWNNKCWDAIEGDAMLLGGIQVSTVLISSYGHRVLD
jgi:hypothetical protein